MKAFIEQSKANGRVTPPSSKSVLHRMIILAMLRNEKITVRNVNLCDDISATLDCASCFADIIKNPDGSVTVIKKSDIAGEVFLNCRESASTLRFFIPICLLLGVRATFTGSRRLLGRPLGYYESLSCGKGWLFKKNDNRLEICGRLSSGEYIIPGNVSSQFISGMMMALSFCKGKSTITIKDNLSGLPYVLLTAQVMKRFGRNVSVDKDTVTVSGGVDISNRIFDPECDCSAAENLYALNCLGGSVILSGMSENSLQADAGYSDMFDALKKGSSVDVSSCPDSAPVLMALSAYFGKGHLSGTKRLKYKESDRANAMAEELKKLGADVQVHEDSVIVSCRRPLRSGITLDSHSDHRIAMSLAVLLTSLGGEIDNAEAVNKSYPDFWNDLLKLGINVSLR